MNNREFIEAALKFYNCLTITELAEKSGWALGAISKVKNNKRAIPSKWARQVELLPDTVLVRDGVVKDYKDITGNWCKIVNGMATLSYRKHQSVLRRLGKGSYKNVAIAEDFKDFNKFADWNQQQIGFDLLGYDLDKDLLSPTEAKIYSFDTCLYLPEGLNRLLFDRDVERLEDLPTGVTKRVWKGRVSYVASIFVDGKLLYLGSYDTKTEAAKAYLGEKFNKVSNWIKDISEGKYLVDERVLPNLYKLLDKIRANGV